MQEREDKPKISSSEMLTKFIQSHHFQWWGDPRQMTTYATLKNDIHKKLVAIIDCAVDEAMSQEPTAYGYREPAHKQEHQWGR